MTAVQRIWRIEPSKDRAIEVRLAAGDNGDQQVVVEHMGTGSTPKYTLEVDVARALAHSILEACEIRSALGSTVDAMR